MRLFLAQPHEYSGLGYGWWFGLSLALVLLGGVLYHGYNAVAALVAFLTVVLVYRGTKSRLSQLQWEHEFRLREWWRRHPEYAGRMPVRGHRPNLWPFLIALVALVLVFSGLFWLLRSVGISLDSISKMIGAGAAFVGAMAAFVTACTAFVNSIKKFRKSLKPDPVRAPKAATLKAEQPKQHAHRGAKTEENDPT